MRSRHYALRRPFTGRIITAAGTALLLNEIELDLTKNFVIGAHLASGWLLQNFIGVEIARQHPLVDIAALRGFRHSIVYVVN